MKRKKWSLCLAAALAALCVLPAFAACEGDLPPEGEVVIFHTNDTHGIRLAGGDEDAYVDNYLGFGLVEDAFRAWPQLSLLRP